MLKNDIFTGSGDTDRLLKLHCLLQVVGVGGTDPAVQDGHNGAEAMDIDIDGEGGALLPDMP